MEVHHAWPSPKSPAAIPVVNFSKTHIRFRHVMIVWGEHRYTLRSTAAGNNRDHPMEHHNLQPKGRFTLFKPQAKCCDDFILHVGLTKLCHRRMTRVVWPNPRRCFGILSGKAWWGEPSRRADLSPHLVAAHPEGSPHPLQPEIKTKTGKSRPGLSRQVADKVWSHPLNVPALACTAALWYSSSALPRSIVHLSTL